MMDWLFALDVAWFRFVNRDLANPVFDVLMPWFSGNALFFPATALAAVALLWAGGRRGRLCVVMSLAVVLLGEVGVWGPLKRAVGRPRPFVAMEDARVRVGRTASYSLPSAHAANWFAATIVVAIFYRRSWRVLAPVAATVAFSRVYNGVHYPSDVAAGAVLGAVWGVLGAGLLDRLWRHAGRRWFGVWWRHLPSLVDPKPPPALGLKGSAAEPGRMATEAYWMRLGYVFIGVTLIARLAYLAAGKIELSEDEAYQWLWSKHLALSYYSKPPMIAYAQFVGTSLWGDRELGVRFLSPVIAAVLGAMVLRFVAREVNARAGFWLLLVVSATPLMAVGSILLTIDPLSVLFWTAALMAGWGAIQRDSTGAWCWVGLWMGLGFLSKYVALCQWFCWALFFALWPPARAQLRRPGPWLALSINALCAVPVLVWNASHDWITVTHLGSRAGLDQTWGFTGRFLWDFLGAESVLMNPVFFVAALWAAVAFWRSHRGEALPVFLFSMGAPLFVGYLLYTLRARVQPNWIAPSVLPLFLLMVVYWERRWRQGAKGVRHGLAAGLALGLPVVVLLHDTNLVGKLAGRPLPAKLDPLRRVRGWREAATVVGDLRQRLLAEGKPVFVIGDHYGITSLVTFYLPEARWRVRREPLVFFQSSDRPMNQFYFWPGYQERKGDTAIYVRESGTAEPAPERLLAEFASVTDLGLHDVSYRGRVLHRLQLFVCRELR